MTDEQQPDASKSAVRRRADTLWATLRLFGRLWGFLAFLVFVIFLFRDVALPFIFGLLVAYLLAPFVRRMQPKVGRALAVIICYVVLLGAIAAFLGLLLPAVVHDLAKLRDSLPVVIERFEQEALPRAEAWVDTTFGDFLGEQARSAPTEPKEIDNQLVLTPRDDGALAVDLDGVRLAVQREGDGVWIVGPATDVETSTNFIAGFRELIARHTGRLTEMIGPAVQAVIAGVAGFITNFVITFMIAAFVLVDLTRVNRFVRSLIPQEYRLDFEELWQNMDRGLGGVVRGQLLICLVNGILTFIGLMIVEVKYAFLLAVMAGLFSLIPIFGTIISSIPIVLIAGVSANDGPSLWPAVVMLLWISAIHLLEANVLNPKIIGDSAHIHPVIVIFALLAGEHMFGLVGALLAIPATSLIQTAYIHARRRSTVFAGEPDAL
jgi:predicted PurR-regulated permease PerM